MTMLQRGILYLLLAIASLVMAHEVVTIYLNLPRFPFSIRVLAILCMFGFAIGHAMMRLGWKRALQLCATVYFISMFFEGVGVATGMVYGPYHYSDRLGMKFLNLVPYPIPIAWFFLIYPVYVIIERLIGDCVVGNKRKILLATGCALSMTALDLLLDPVMVRHSVWIWEESGIYYGIPLHNFLGWFVTVFTALMIYLSANRDECLLQDARLDRLAIVYLMMLLVPGILVAFHDNLPVPALLALMIMAPLLIFGWRATRWPAGQGGRAGELGSAA